MRSVERNPLRAGLAPRAEQRRWSSLGCIGRQNPPPAMIAAWPLPRPASWLEWVNQPQSEAELAARRRAADRDCPSLVAASLRQARTAMRLLLPQRLQFLALAASLILGLGPAGPRAYGQLVGGTKGDADHFSGCSASLLDDGCFLGQPRGWNV